MYSNVNLPILFTLILVTHAAVQLQSNPLPWRFGSDELWVLTPIPPFFKRREQQVFINIRNSVHTITSSLCN